VRAIQKEPRLILEVCRTCIKHRQIQSRLQKLKNNVRFEDGILRRSQLFADARHSLSQHALARPPPDRPLSSRGKESRRIRAAGPAPLLAHGNRMVVRLAVAGLAVGSAKAMTILRDLQGSPVV